MGLTLALLLIAQAGGRETLTIQDSWGAFRERAPRRCYAMAAPVQKRREAFVSVATWPGERAKSQVHVRLSRARRGDASVTLAIGERRFALTAGPRDAWAPDSITDRTIVAAMRGARSLSVETIDARGRPFVDVYRLTGAATAIDAAGVGCAG